MTVYEGFLTNFIRIFKCAFGDFNFFSFLGRYYHFKKIDSPSIDFFFFLFNRKSENVEVLKCQPNVM